ncbi:MAG: hypothetical protein ACI4PU_04840, partial [Intestinibacter sp.]
MGRCFKLIMSFLISIFIVMNNTFAYEIEDFNLNKISCLFNSIEFDEFRQLKANDNLKNTNKQSLNNE